MKDMPSIVQLESLEATLAGTFDMVSLRGITDGPFLFVHHNGRSVEVSTNSNGDSWWLEFWDRSEDEDAAPVAEQTVNSEADAIDALRKWLLVS